MDTEQDSSKEVVAEDSDTQHTKVSTPSDHGSESAVSVKTHASVWKELIEIERRFNKHDASNTFELDAPDMTFPKLELTDWQNTSVAGDWLRIKNKYENAKKINELGHQYGRIKPICSDLETLTKSFPGSPTLKRVLAYFYLLSDDWGNALQNYQEAAIQSKQADDWFSLAVSALKLNKKELACYSLEQYFHENAVINEPKTWAIYANLMATFNNHSAFRERCRNDDFVVEENLDILLDTAIYLLYKAGNEASVSYVIQKRQEEESTKSLLVEACQFLGGEPIESYHYFLKEFRKAETLLKDKLTKPISSNTAKKPTPHTTSSKKKQTPKKQTPSFKEQQTPQRSLSNELARKAAENGNLEEAVELYQECLQENVNNASAINDLAAVYLRLKLPEKAVDILEGYRRKKGNKVPAAINNQLINCYGHTKEYGKAINLLNFALKHSQDAEKQFHIRMQIANLYNLSEEYDLAEKQFIHLQRMRPDNITVQHNLAICFAKQKNYDEAKKLLQTIQETAPDVKTAELLEKIEKFEKGNSNSDIEFATELRRFELFHLERCEFSSVPGIRIWEGKYVGNAEQGKKDIGRAVENAKRHQTIRPEDRKKNYLTAARIYFDLEDYNDDLYRYLCRCYASMGDDAKDKRLNLDTIRGYYYEALRVYDVIYHDDGRIEEQDAGNALSRFLFSYLGIEEIPRSSPKLDTLKEQKEYIFNAIETVISKHPDTNIIFDAIGYLLNSRYAKNHILPCLYDNSRLNMKAVKYLQDNGIETCNIVASQEDFDRWWNRLQAAKVRENLIISSKFDAIETDFEFTTASLESSIEHVRSIQSILFFKLDRDYIESLDELLTVALNLCNEVSFDAQDDRCEELEKRCFALLTSIEENPTSLSIERIRSIIKIIENKVNEYRKSLYETSRPELELRLYDSYIYTPKDGKINVQIVIENEKGRMAANSLELIIMDNKEYFFITDNEIKVRRSLRGGEQHIQKVTLNLAEEVLSKLNEPDKQDEQDKVAFSFSFYVKYNTNEDKDLTQTPTETRSIRIGSENKFKRIENPYSTYATGLVVDDDDMFFGRTRLINRITNSIQTAGDNGKCILVYGQYRSGKSSLRVHLKKKLMEEYPTVPLLVVDLGNIDGIEDSEVEAPFLYQLFVHIIKELNAAIKDKVENSEFLSLSYKFPENPDEEIKMETFTQNKFTSIFSNFKKALQEEWGIKQVVLLIDEFQEVYDKILAGELGTNFMTTWKNFLSENLFSAVLVGQQVMMDFKTRFKNVFAAITHEPVTYLNKDDAEDLITKPILVDGQSRYRERSIERILELTACSPYYIQIICDRLVNHMNDVVLASWVTEADVEEVTTNLIKEYDESDFHNLLASGDKSGEAIPEDDALTVLQAIAKGANETTNLCPRPKIHCSRAPSVDVDKILSDLKRRDVVEVDDDCYRIKVGLFRRWLIHS